MNVGIIIGGAIVIVGGMFLMSAKTQASPISPSVRLSKGLRNNNPGNIRYIPPSRAWNGQIGDDGAGYGIYDTMQNGVRASGRQLLKYASEGLTTIRAIVSKWAPASENDVLAYVNNVSAQMKLSSVQPFNVRARLPELAWAMFNHENGSVAVRNALAFEDVKRWVYL